MISIWFFALIMCISGLITGSDDILTIGIVSTAVGQAIQWKINREK